MALLDTIDDDTLGRLIASARNRRDAYAEGREPAWVMHELRCLLDEQAARRERRRAARQAVAGNVG